MTWRFSLIAIGRIFTAIAVLIPFSANAQNVRISGLSDVNFGTILNFSVDYTDSQNVCIYSSGISGTYHVTATGSGAGGAFTLASGSNTLAYEVQWADTANQPSGTSLASGVALYGQSASAFFSGCFFGIFPTASLVTVLRASETSAATTGSYAGTLTLLVAPN
ncbi:MAG: hypothetical protein KUG65_00725 [Sphingomonadaceae bacterium]|nr:hypothetical protein [Sphingomonadaceae bacterium]